MLVYTGIDWCRYETRTGVVARFSFFLILKTAIYICVRESLPPPIANYLMCTAGLLVQYTIIVYSAAGLLWYFVLLYLKTKNRHHTRIFY